MFRSRILSIFSEEQVPNISQNSLQLGSAVCSSRTDQKLCRNRRKKESFASCDPHHVCGCPNHRRSLAHAGGPWSWKDRGSMKALSWVSSSKIQVSESIFYKLKPFFKYLLPFFKYLLPFLWGNTNSNHFSSISCHFCEEIQTQTIFQVSLAIFVRKTNGILLSKKSGIHLLSSRSCKFIFPYIHYSIYRYRIW